jgi:DNA-directed RNA polymerase specialized sigma24 family protein
MDGQRSSILRQEFLANLGNAICEEERVRMEEAHSRVEARLEEKTRQAFRLLVDEGCSVEEVARRLGMSKFLVWQTRSHVLRKIRQELREADAFANE